MGFTGRPPLRLGLPYGDQRSVLLRGDDEMLERVLPVVRKVLPVRWDDRWSAWSVPPAVLKMPWPEIARDLEIDVVMVQWRGARLVPKQTLVHWPPPPPGKYPKWQRK